MVYFGLVFRVFFFLCYILTIYLFISYIRNSLTKPILLQFYLPFLDRVTKVVLHFQDSDGVADGDPSPVDTIKNISVRAGMDDPFNLPYLKPEHVRIN